MGLGNGDRRPKFTFKTLTTANMKISAAGVTLEKSLRHDVVVYFSLILMIFISSWMVLVAIEPDDQWLYLPALKRVKRISSNNKSGPFMGSEFAFEDLSSQEVEKYTYKYLRDENLNGMDSFILERYPVDKKSGYTRQVVWFDKAEYRPLKIVYYDRKNALLKTLEYDDYRQYIDKIWRAHSMSMVNHQTGKSTLLTWKDYKFRNGYTDRDFNKNSLKNAR
ncbi:MAG: outer membrane lipoprotein-sorting protein [Planctomycetes bacterium]|nr:outer membrane lipoprotein-sorting protein [Planctomycetota bacterium]